jgi:hypothetical protein
MTATTRGIILWCSCLRPCDVACDIAVTEVTEATEANEVGWDESHELAFLSPRHCARLHHTCSWSWQGSAVTCISCMRQQASTSS